MVNETNASAKGLRKSGTGVTISTVIPKHNKYSKKAKQINHHINEQCTVKSFVLQVPMIQTQN